MATWKRPRSDKKPDGYIELEPSAYETTPRWVEQARSGPLGDGSDGPVAVPEKPLHLCPTCDYILTGLTSRRCPECGEAFTLSEARRRAFELSDGMKAFHRSIRYERILFALGVALIVVGFILPWVSYTRGLGSSGLSINPRGWMSLLLAPVVLVMWMMLRVYYDVRWLYVVLATGVMVFVFGAALAM